MTNIDICNTCQGKRIPENNIIVTKVTVNKEDIVVCFKYNYHSIGFNLTCGSCPYRLEHVVINNE